MRYPVAGLASLIAPEAAWAEEWSVSGSARVRGEATRNDFRAGAPTRESAILTRLTMFVGYEAGGVEAAVEVQDARVFGEPDGAIDQDDANALEPIQAYVRTRLDDATTLQLGRFTMDFGSRRLSARPNFRNTSASFTGARLDIARDDTRIMGFWTMPAARLPDDRAGIRNHRVQLDRERLGFQFFGGYVEAGDPARGAVDVTVARLHERDAPGIATRDRRLWTVSLRHRRDPAKGRFDHEVEGAVQGGRARASSQAADRDDRPVSAGFVHVAGGYTWRAPWSPRLQLAFDYATGERPGRTLARYDTNFGDGSFEFGPSSLFSLLARANLVSAEARVEVEPGARTDAYLAIRPAWLASATDRFGNSEVRDPAGRSGRYAGTMIEGRARRWLAPDRLRLSLGGAYLAKGRFLRDAPNAPRTGNTLYGYAELTAEF